MGITPEALKKRPKLDVPLRWYLEAFYDISRGRQITMGGAGPIAVSEILAFAQLYGIEAIEERVQFLRLIGALDTVYLNHCQKKQELNKRQSD